MDLDLDLEYSDRISDFLRSKLQGIKSENAELQSALRHREEAARSLRRDLAKPAENRPTFGTLWKKTVNGTYVLGLELKNDSACAFTNIIVTLTWTSSNPISYKFHVLSPQSLKPLSSLKDSAHVIITLDIPLFTDRLSYTLTGLMTMQQNSKKVSVKFPSSFELTPADTTDGTVVVDFFKAIDGSREDFLAVAMSGEKEEFMMVLPQNFGRLIEDSLELDCALHKVGLKSEGKFFLVYKISPSLDGTLLELPGNHLDQIVQLNTYSKDLQTTIALLHYLHSRLSGVVIIPKPLYRPDLSLVELTDLAKTSLLKELDSFKEASGDLRTLRTKIVDLEHETDTLVARMNEKRQNTNI